MSFMGSARSAWNIYQENGIHSVIRSITNHICGKIAELQSFLRYLCYRAKYGSSTPQPSKLIYVDPRNVNYKLFPRFFRRVSNYGMYIKDGDWDVNYSENGLIHTINHKNAWNPDPGQQILVHFDDHILFRACKARFRNEVPWKETMFYNQCIRYLNNDKYWNNDGRYGSIQAIHRRLLQIDRIFSSIKEKGYLTQRELANQNSRPEDEEVVISIGRDGELIQDGGGQHRLMIAKILGINEIPVRVFVRHKEWQNLRREISNTALIAELSPQAKQYRHHPDVQDVIPKK